MEIRKNPIRDKVRAAEPICGSHIALNDVVIAELMSYAGYDFIWLDTEHTTIDYQTLMQQIDKIQKTDTAAFVRLSMHDRNHTKRVLEMGPDGVIFPMINTPEEADYAMQSCMYPPKGCRGFGPLQAVRYGMIDLDEYIRSADENLCRFIQIETKTAVGNLQEIIKNPYIDGYIFGPCDLSGSIGQLNQVFGEDNTVLLRCAVDILKKEGKCIGVSTGSDDPAVVKYWYDMGINMISSGNDYAYVLNGATQNRMRIRKIFADDQ